MRDLIEKLEALTEPSNAIDIQIEIALFEPDADYASVCPNNAGTKVIYTDRGENNHTFWAADYTLTAESRARCIAMLKAKEARDDA